MDESYSPNATEFSEEKRAEGVLLWKRILLIIGYLAFSLLYFCGCFLAHIPQMIPGLPLFLLILVLCTWRFVSYDVSYRFISGTVTFSRTYGARMRRTTKEIFSLRVAEAEAIVAKGNKRVRDLLPGRRLYDFAKTESAPDLVYIFFCAKNGNASAVRFTCTKRMAHLLGVYCEHANIKDVPFRY